jgi:hypothetical protein
MLVVLVVLVLGAEGRPLLKPGATSLLSAPRVAPAVAAWGWVGVAAGGMLGPKGLDVVNKTGAVDGSVVLAPLDPPRYDAAAAGATVGEAEGVLVFCGGASASFAASTVCNFVGVAGHVGRVETRRGLLPTPVTQATAAAAFRWVLLVGGRDAAGAPVARVEVIDAANKSHVATLPFPPHMRPASRVAVAVLDVPNATVPTKIAVAGAGDGRDAAVSAALFAIRVTAADGPQIVPTTGLALGTPRRRTAAGATAGAVVLAGGATADGAPTAEVTLCVVANHGADRVDFVCDNGTRLATPRFGAAAAYLAPQDCVVVAGGAGAARTERSMELVAGGRVYPTDCVLPAAALRLSAMSMPDRVVFLGGMGADQRPVANAAAFVISPQAKTAVGV